MKDVYMLYDGTPSVFSFTIQANKNDTIIINGRPRAYCGNWEFISALRNGTTFKPSAHNPPFSGSIAVWFGCTEGEYDIILEGNYSPQSYLVHFSIHPVNVVGLEESSAPVYLLRVFPNPANDQVSVSSITGAISDISLFSSTGNLVIQVKPGGREAQLNLSDLPKGMYSLSATLEDRKRIVKKLIID